MGKIEKILKKGPVEGQTTEVYPVTSTKAVYDENNKRLDNIITRLQESVYLNTPIPISTENTPESIAQNVTNIADYVEKAKAAGIANVDGMAVTCIIDGGCSGVGYLYVYTANEITIQGVLIKDDLVENMCFNIYTDGSYNERALIVADNNKAVVTSDMLDEGARKPIILTPDTTEVDEETYQKLLSDDVDVVYNTINMTTKDIDSDKNITMTFSYAICTADIMQIASIDIQISSTSPHLVVKGNQAEQTISPEQVVNKSTLSPVLKKINLIRGNNSAVIKQFEADWENLNGSLYGARFIGFPVGTLPVLFMKDDFNDCYIGYTDRNIDGGPDSTGPFKKITLCANNNYNLKVTDVTATVQYIDLNATTTNLTSIGAVQQNTPHCFTYTKGSEIIKGVGQVWQSRSYGYLEGISFDGKYRVHAEVQANGAATVTLTSIGAQKLLQPVLQEIDLIGTDAERKAKLDQFETDWKALTGASDILGARFVGRFNNNNYNSIGLFYYNQDTDYEGISFSDTLGYRICKVVVNPSTGSLTITPLFSHLEAITIWTGNTPDDKAANVAAIKAYVDNLKLLGVDTTKGYTIPIRTSDGIIGEIYPDNNKYRGFVIKDMHSYAIVIGQDGTLVTWFLLDSNSDYAALTTINKRIIPAINEVNDLANGKQDKLTSGTNIKTINNQSLLGGGNIEISAPSITVDTTMSDTSTNPVQNKVIKAYIDGLVGNVAAQLAQI